MAVVTPDKMDFSNDNIIMILSGLPGVGKTTLACSAPDVVVVDVDNGMKRVKMEHRKASIIVKSYEELLEDLKSPYVKQANTLVIDTGGALIEMMKDWAMKQPSGSKTGGGISQQGYGIVKSEFKRLFWDIRVNYNCILIFHTLKEKDKDGNIVYDIQCEGATKQTVWQPADLGAYMQIINGKRHLCFTPTQEYTAKSCYGIVGMREIPELKDGALNNCMEGLFLEAKDFIAKENMARDVKLHEYSAVMDQGRAIIGGIVDPATAQQATEELNALKAVLTSKEELKHAIKLKLNEQGLKWNRELKTYEQIPSNTELA